MISQAQILIVIGSKSDEEVMAGCRKLLDEFGIAYDFEICSAHRNPNKTGELASKAQEKGIKVIIAAAGMAAALPGVIASYTTLPVIGVPIAGSALGGIDALMSISQMPAGVPVATVAIGGHGAKNAALLAIRILGLSDTKLAKKLKTYMNKLAQG